LIAPPVLNDHESQRRADASSDDDDNMDDLNNPDLAPNDLIFSEFKKVTRNRYKYKCELKNAIVHISGKDYVLKTLQADFTY